MCEVRVNIVDQPEQNDEGAMTSEQRIEVSPISPALGAVVSGVQIAEATVEELDQIKRAFAEHLVLVFPDQRLDSDAHVAVAEHFGTPYVHPFLESVPDHPAILQVLKEPDEADTFGGEYWHCDISYEQPPAAVSLLHAKELPPLGGDTLFANQYLAYESLSHGMRKLLEPLRAHHTYPNMSEADRGASALHRVVRVHPVTGRRALYLNGAFVSRFEAMSPERARRCSGSCSSTK